MQKRKQSKNQIGISKTKAEWDMINSKISQNSKGNLNSFLRREIRKLPIKFSDTEMLTPICKQTIRKYHYVSPDCFEILHQLSEKIQKPIPLIINKLILDPLLRDQ